jgi:hypothetical protein
MLAQKIALELFELEAISVANASAMLEHALGLESRRSGRRFAGIVSTESTFTAPACRTWLVPPAISACWVAPRSPN